LFIKAYDMFSTGQAPYSIPATENIPPKPLYNNILPGKHPLQEIGKYQDVDAVIGDLIGQLSTTKELKRSGIEPFPYSKGNVNLMGKQFVAQYRKDEEMFRQWIVVLPRPKGEVFHTWFYTSPITQYDNFLGIAKTMLNSWSIAE
jgi:hypothetical protein